MAELKTKKNDASVEAFLNAVEDERKREDAKAVARLLTEVTGEKPTMWGAAIVGFGECRLKYASGRELDWMVVGFSPRKTSLTLYLPGGIERLQPLLARLGKHKTGEVCLYVKRLADVDLDVLREVVATAIANVGTD